MLEIADPEKNRWSNFPLSIKLVIINRTMEYNNGTILDNTIIIGGTIDPLFIEQRNNSPIV